jgi:hypothetical protein
MSEAEDKLREDVARMFTPAPAPAPETEEEAPEDDEEEDRETPSPGPEILQRARDAVIKVILQGIDQLISSDGIKGLMEDEGIGPTLDNDAVNEVVRRIETTLRENDLNSALDNLNGIVS